MTVRIITEIDMESYRRLLECAFAERRRPRDQARWLLEQALRASVPSAGAASAAETCRGEETDHGG